MPMKIECPDCHGIGWCPRCDHGDLIVYTQAELDEARKEERERCAEICARTAKKVDPHANPVDYGAWLAASDILEAIRKMEDI